MMEIKLGQLITIYGGLLMCAMGDVYKILSYLTGDTLFTRQLPRACRECQPYLRSVYPWLEQLNLDHVNRDNWKAVHDDLVEKHGDSFDVQPIPKGAHTMIHPVDELAQMTGKPVMVTDGEQSFVHEPKDGTDATS